jgi:3-oxoacyl-[acyl-carrier protein] reductase
MAVALAPRRSSTAWRRVCWTALARQPIFGPSSFERSASGSLLKKPADKDDCADMVVAMCRVWSF